MATTQLVSNALGSFRKRSLDRARGRALFGLFSTLLVHLVLVDLAYGGLLLFFNILCPRWILFSLFVSIATALAWKDRRRIFDPSRISEDEARSILQELRCQTGRLSMRFSKYLGVNDFRLRDVVIEGPRCLIEAYELWSTAVELDPQLIGDCEQIVFRHEPLLLDEVEPRAAVVLLDLDLARIVTEIRSGEDRLVPRTGALERAAGA